MGTYVNNLRLLEITTGDESGTWGTKTNTNLELIADAFGSGTEAITTNADTHTTTIADGAADEGRAIFLKYTGTLDSACTITLAPNTVNKLWFIENATSGSQNIIINQGTSGGTGGKVTIGNGKIAAVYTDGSGDNNAAVLDAFADLELSSTLTVAGAITGSSTIQGTTITATTAFVPDASDGAALGTASLEFSDLFLADEAVISFGDDDDVTLTHVADTGLLLNSTMALQFNDASQYINAPTNAILDINATDEIELNATAVDLNGTLDVSGASTLTGAVTASGGITSTAASNTFGASSFNDADITNVGDIALDSISSDGSAIGIGASGDTVTCEGAWIFNEGSNDVDFRIESNDSTHVFNVDASADAIGVGLTSAPGSIIVIGPDTLSGTDPGGGAGAPNAGATAIGNIRARSALYVRTKTGTGAGMALAMDSDGMPLIQGMFTDDSTARTVILGPYGGGGAVPSGGKFYLDAGSNTYIHESSGDTIQMVVGGTSHFQVQGDGVIIPTAHKLYLDGGGDTYITEGSGNVIRFYAGGAKQFECSDTNLSVVGALSKGSGSFRIDHPLDSMKDTHDLVHSFVEGPRADLIYRDSVTLSGGTASVDLDAAVGLTDGTWEALCRDPQVWVQNEDGWTQVRGEVSGSTLTITAQDSDCTDTVSWLVVAERQDQNIREADWTDAEGHPILEPEKEEDES